VVDADQEIDFGTNVVNRAGLSIHFPQAELYFGVAVSDIPQSIQTLIGSNGDCSPVGFAARQYHGLD
jgi:hypothetical protein